MSTIEGETGREVIELNDNIALLLRCRRHCDRSKNS